VVLGEKGGYYIKPLLPSDIHEIREFRKLGAIRLAFKKMDKSQYATLEKICVDFSSMVEKGYLNGALGGGY
jgi:DNA-binding GntR family transcriptional regulator